MKKEMLINVLQPEECRIAIVEDGVLEELYVERASQESYVGNIYKGRIVNIEPSIQAAFVDFGIGRNGFLHVSDVAPAYYKHLLSKADLADYESELERQFTGGSDRDASESPSGGHGRAPRGRGRGDREEGGERGERAPREMKTWLPRTSDSQGGEVSDDPDFGAGLVDGGGPRHEFVEEAFETSGEAFVVDKPEVGEGLIEEVLKEAPPAVDEDLGDFGVGLDVGTEEPLAAAEEPAAEAAEPAKGRRPRTRKPRVKAEGAEGETADPKAKSRPRRGRGKAEEPASEEAPANTETPPDDKPRYMGSAERRTSGEDEPEITPFFDETPGFDPDGPNDRFAEGAADQEPAEPIGRFGAEDPESAEDSEGEAREMAQEESGFAEAPLNDDGEASRPQRGGRGNRDRDRGERGDRGDRSGRSGSRDRDRDRGGDRGGDRGDRGGRTGRSGPGGGRAAPAGRSGPGGRTGPRDRGLPRFPIQEIFKRGQEVIVQVIKEGMGTKGPTLSTYVSIAGRYLVLMPSLNRVGVSRKIEDHEARRRLRDIMATLGPPKGVGFIVRTAAVDRDAKELQNDLAYLLRLWQVVVRRIKRMPSPVEIFRESDMITRTIRDIFSPDIDTIWVDEPNAFAHASEFLQVVMPQFAGRIRYFSETEPLFHKYGIENEIAKINQKRLDLPQGGSIIIEQTEALVAIDVNSGNFRAENDAEETAYRMNMLAAREIARQLRLRDLGGVIVNDFIDMRREEHRRNVEQVLRDALRRDRARTKILRISQFGIIEMTRQRIQPSLKKRIFNECPHCRATGYVKTSETLSIDVMRMLQLAAHRSPAVQSIQINVQMEVAHYLLNKKRKEIAALEERAKMEILISGVLGVSPDTLDFKCLDQNGSEVRLMPVVPVRLAGGRGPRLERGSERERGDRDRGDRGDRDRGERGDRDRGDRDRGERGDRDRGDRDRGDRGDRRSPQPLD